MAENAQPVTGAPSPSPEKTANWPANPGPTQKNDRGNGVPKVKTATMEDI